MGRTEVIIDILVNSRDSARELDQTAHKFGAFGSAMEGLAAPAGMALGAIGGLAAGAAKAASDMQQSSGGVDAVFKESAGAVHDWAKTSAEDVGLAASEYNTMAAGIGGALSGMGVPLDEAAQSTHDLMLRAADLASVFGGTTAQATEAVSSAFRGEYDSLQRLIPSISGAAVEAKIAAEASAGMTYASEEAAKAGAITNLIMEESAGAAGNFAKESDTAAGAQAIATAKFQDTAAALGEQLLPALTTVMEWLSKVGNWVSEHIPLVTTLIGVIGGLAAAVLLINAGMALYSAAQTVATIATGAWSAAAGLGAVATTALGAAVAFLTSPITLIVLAIGALIAIVVLLVKNWDTVAEVATKCWETIKSAASSVLDWLKETVGSIIDGIKSAWSGFADFLSGIWDGIKQVAGVAFEAIKTIAMGPIGALLKILEMFGIDTEDIFEGIKTVATAIWGAIKSAAETALAAILWPINKVKDAITWVIDKIKSAISFASTLASKIPFIGGLFSAPAQPAPAPHSAVSLAGLAPRLSVGRRASGDAAGGIHIEVNGALDPVAVARQINTILTKQGRRQFGVRVSDRGLT